MAGCMGGLLRGGGGKGVMSGTYPMLVTLLVSQLPMAWLNAEAPENMKLHMTHSSRTKKRV